MRYEPWAQAEIRRLEELKATAVEVRIDAELAQGDHARLAGQLEAPVTQQPLRERLRAQLMIALYRSGRHADALAAFRNARDVLDELGLEPGPELRELEQRILVHDPALAAPGPAEQAPVPPTPTFGRDADVRAVLHALAETRLLTLAGTGGVGKTRLAIELARAAGGPIRGAGADRGRRSHPAVVCDALGVVRATDEPDAAALDMAALAGAAGDDRRAAVLAGAAAAIDALPVSPAARPVYHRLEQRFLAPSQERLGEEEWETASAEGRRMEADAAVAYALEPAFGAGR